MFCPYCGKEIQNDLSVCPHCGAPAAVSPNQNLDRVPNRISSKPIQTAPPPVSVQARRPMQPVKKKQQAGFIVEGILVGSMIMILVLVAVFGGRGTHLSIVVPGVFQEAGDSSTAVKTDSKAIAESQSDNGWYKAGSYKIGTDLPPGEYIVECVHSRSSVYLQVSSDSSGKSGSIVTNDNFYTHTYVTVDAGQYLTVERGKIQLASKVKPYSAKDGRYGEGTYKVGKDIPAGEYQAHANTSRWAYLEVSENSTGVSGSIVTNENFQGSRYITVEEGQYLKVMRGYFTAA